MEKCKYCGIEFHPMVRWTKPGELIYVCQLTIKRTDSGDITIIPGSDCEVKAAADGYTRRVDLTPSR